MLSDYTLDPQRLVHVGTFQFDDPNAPELTPRALRRRQRALFPDDVGTAHEDSDDDADEDRDDSTTLPYLPRRRRGPKKILLSPNKQLLLINGTFFNERSSLVVYFIIRFSLSAFRFQFSFFLSFPVLLLFSSKFHLISLLPSSPVPTLFVARVSPLLDSFPSKHSSLTTATVVMDSSHRTLFKRSSLHLVLCRAQLQTARRRPLLHHADFRGLELPLCGRVLLAKFRGHMFNNEKIPLQPLFTGFGIREGTEALFWCCTGKCIDNSVTVISAAFAIVFSRAKRKAFLDHFK